MPFAISTHWNAGRHDRGEEMLDEILVLGIDRVELGYNLHAYHVPGVRRYVADGTIRVTSVHNYCPVPVKAAVGHPELYTLADPRESVRNDAVEHTTATIRFAAEVGATVVVMHGGNVRMRAYHRKLQHLYRAHKRWTDRYERLKYKASLAREKKARRELDYLYRGLERLLPVLDQANMLLALENLPHLEAMPNELELPPLLRAFAGSRIRCWHDTGHGQIREQLGYANHLASFEQNLDRLAGMHVHDVRPPLQDHAMPPDGQVDFQAFAGAVAAHPDLPLVLEPAPGLPPDQLVRGLNYLRRAWTAS